MLALPDLDNAAFLWIPQQADILHSCTGRSYGPIQLGLRRNEHFKVVYVQEVNHLIIIIIIIIVVVVVVVVVIGAKTRSITLRLCRLFLIDSNDPPSAKLFCGLIGSNVRLTRGEVRFEEAVAARSSTTLKHKIIKSH